MCSVHELSSFFQFKFSQGAKQKQDLTYSVVSCGLTLCYVNLNTAERKPDRYCPIFCKIISGKKMTAWIGNLPRNLGERTSNSCASKSFSHNPVLQFHEGEYSFFSKIKENGGRENWMKAVRRFKLSVTR